jgi:very-short-patch-repair endonuclease
VIELDGYSHTFDQQVDYDQARDRWLKSQGCKILRFSADQDERDFTDRVVATIYRELTEVPAPGPHPRFKEAS